MKFFWKKTDDNNSDNPEMHETGPENAEKRFTPKRIIIGMLLTLAVLWVIITVIGFFVPSTSRKMQNAEINNQINNQVDTLPTPSIAEGIKKSITETLEPSPRILDQSQSPETTPVPKKPDDAAKSETAPSATPATPAATPSPIGDKRPGIAVTEAIISPLEYELRGRFWGWRVNDLIQITDNVQNYQLGVLEVSRRAIVALAERMSRSGSAVIYDPNLEMAMNWIMVKADAYWFPSAESKYKETIRDLQAYIDRLERGVAPFYTRTDNLIPMLASFEDLLGACYEILAKMEEDDGKKVSFFKADDYFFYTKGVIDSMLVILEAINIDFYRTLEARRSLEILEDAIDVLNHGKKIKPWFILNSSPSSIFANHRHNLAVPVSQARFHLGLLIKALST